MDAATHLVTSALRDDPPTLRMSLGDATAIPDRFRNGVIAMGTFDGVHLGHQQLVASAGAMAEESGTNAIAFTFEPHPRALFQPDAPLFRLTDPASRRSLLAIAGATGIVEVAFDRDLAALGPEEFFEEILMERLAVRGVTIGDAFRFGKGRAGDADTMRALGDRHGVGIRALPPVCDPSGEMISSGRVRDALRSGDVAAAAELLGYRWFVTGKVIPGDRRGRELGYPTANIALSPAPELALGIYAVTAHLGSSVTNIGVASFGVRPTFGGGEPLLEVHLFDFEGDLYGQDVAIVFHSWIRGEEKFSSVEALVRQMDKDSAQARAVLTAAYPSGKVDRALTEWF